MDTLAIHSFKAIFNFSVKSNLSFKQPHILCCLTFKTLLDSSNQPDHVYFVNLFSECILTLSEGVLVAVVIPVVFSLNYSFDHD